MLATLSIGKFLMPTGPASPSTDHTEFLMTDAEAPLSNNPLTMTDSRPICRNCSCPVIAVGNGITIGGCGDYGKHWVFDLGRCCGPSNHPIAVSPAVGHH